MERIIKTNLDGEIANEILNGVIGQMSDGMFEESNYYNGFWMFVHIDESNNIHVSKFWGKTCWNKYYRNKFILMSDYEIKEFFAKMIKRIIHQELRNNNISVRGKFKKGNMMQTEYLNYDRNVTINDCATVYDALMRKGDQK